MPRPKSAVPTYRRHRTSGNAFCDYHDPITGRKRTIVLGRWNSAESRKEHARICAEVAAGRTAATRSITVNELMLAFLKFAKGYYVKADAITGEVGAFKAAIKFVRPLYGHVLVAEFGPIALETVRDSMVKGGLARTTINRQIGRVRRIFRWGVARQMVAPTILTALAAVDPLRQGRSGARETQPIGPVADASIEAVLPILRPMVADIVRIQRLTGMRPAEACGMHADGVEAIDGGAWRYRPRSHKTEHHGRERVVFVGPKAQAVLAPYLERAQGGYLFSPARSEAARSDERHAKRRTKLWASHALEKRASRRRKRGVKARAFCPHYRTDSYRRAIARACEAAGVPSWHPNQIRHTTATELRKRFGLEASKVVLGHSEIETTQIYAERDLDYAKRIITEVG